jgi:hypothetical protein
MTQHLFGDFEIGDDAVLHGSNRHDVAGGPAQHLFGIAADGEDLAALSLDGDDGGLVDDDPLALDIDQRVGGAQVDRQIIRKPAQHSICDAHGSLLRPAPRRGPSR